MFSRIRKSRTVSKSSPKATSRSTPANPLLQRATEDPEAIKQLQKTHGNAFVLRLLAESRQQSPQADQTGVNTLVQRQYLDLSEGSRIPEGADYLGENVNISDEGDWTPLHIFAHSSGDSLFAIEDVADMPADVFAQWLVDNNRAYAEEETDWGKIISNEIYIHACASTKFASDVKKALVEINAANSGITVYGTRGISATSPTEEQALVVIPMKRSTDWLKFEEKLAKNKGRQEEIAQWEKIYWKFPNGYDNY